MILDGEFKLPEIQYFNTKISGMGWESFVPVMVAGMSRDKVKVQQKLIEVLKGRKTSNLCIWHLELDNDVWYISIWDDASHDYMLELDFKL